MAYLIRLATLPHVPWEARCLRCGGLWLAALLFSPSSRLLPQTLHLGPGTVLPPMQCPHCRQDAGELEGRLPEPAADRRPQTAGSGGVKRPFASRKVDLPTGPRGKKVKRDCLRCDLPFNSYGKRICPECTAINASLLRSNTWEALVYGVGGER